MIGGKPNLIWKALIGSSDVTHVILRSFWPWTGPQLRKFVRSWMKTVSRVAARLENGGPAQGPQANPGINRQRGDARHVHTMAVSPVQLLTKLPPL
jgi:hypothetical protein